MNYINKIKNPIFLIYMLVGIVLLTACGGGGGGDRDEPVPVPNTAPTAPALISPTDKSICVSNIVPLSWNPSTDAQGDVITYHIQVATDNQFSQVAHSGTTGSSSYTVTLDKGKAYYWRVKAVDSKGAGSDYSTTFSFYTEAAAVSNHLPFMPELVKPAENSVVAGTTADLQWNASDVDTADQLSFDVYFGTDRNNLTVTKSGITTKTTQVTGLSTNTTYFWKVVVKDGKGGETIGQIWSFKTS